MSILKKIWPYVIIGIVLLIFLPDLTAITKELAAFIAGVVGFLFWSKRTKLDTKPAKAEADEHENIADIRLKEAIAELEQVATIRDNIKEQAKKIEPIPDEPAPGKVRKVFKAR